MLRGETDKPHVFETAEESSVAVQKGLALRTVWMHDLMLESTVLFWRRLFTGTSCCFSQRCSEDFETLYSLLTLRMLFRKYL